MYIKEIYLSNYRSYKQFSLHFDKNLQVLIGNNAQGKTNLLEAIYVLAFAKSHRTTEDKDLINWHEEYAKIKGDICKKNSVNTQELIFTKKGKKARIDLIEKQKLSQYIGNLNVVMFAPEDLNIVKGSPQIRRRFMDMELGQISIKYLQDLSLYQKILKQRNAILKNYKNQKTLDVLHLDILTNQFIDQCCKVTKTRYKFLKMIETFAKEVHFKISSGKEELKLKYCPSIDVSDCLNMSKMKDEYTEFYNKTKDKEKIRGLTLFGNHRDDFFIFVNQKELQSFGSQGQQRTASLSIKLAELDMIREQTGEYPILLLDDVLSELDPFRQTHLLNTIQDKVQTFVTTTSIEGIEHKALENATIFHIENSKVEKIR